MSENILRIKIDNTDVFIEELGEGRGKVTISDTYNHNYSYFWGAAGGGIKEFLCRINSEYFADKLLGANSCYEMDVKKTFTEIRKYISNEIGLEWYKHQEFQKHMREVLSQFQEQCEDVNDERYFVDSFFSSFVNQLDFYLIGNRSDEKYYEESFKNISEHWYFIAKKPNREYLWLMKLHSKLKKQLQKENKKHL